MFQPDNPQSRDFTESLREETSRRLNEPDLEVLGIVIPPAHRPPKDAPPVDIVDPPVDLPGEEAVFQYQPKKSKVWLLLPLLALGGGAAFVYSQSQRPSTSLSQTDSAEIVQKPVQRGVIKANVDRTQLKALWAKGAASKKRGDYAAARAAWQEGLKIEPNNVGFRESLSKLDDSVPSSY